MLETKIFIMLCKLKQLYLLNEKKNTLKRFNPRTWCKKKPFSYCVHTTDTKYLTF